MVGRMNGWIDVKMDGKMAGRIKRHCQQDPQEMETGGSAEHHGTIFFGFLMQN